MSQRAQTTLILALVFVIGLGAGVSTMIWAWPAFAARFSKPPARSTVALDYMRRNIKPAPSPEQFARLDTIVKSMQEKSHELDQQFAPQYSKVCEEYTQIRTQENAAFLPYHTEAQNEIQATLTPEQWATYQQQQASFQRARQGNGNPNNVRRPWLCGPQMGGPGDHGSGHGGPGGPDGPPPGSPHFH